MRGILILFWLLPIALPVGAAPRVLTLTPRGSQVHTYSHGVPWVASDGDVSVAFSVDHAPKRRMRIDVVVVNGSNEPLTVIDSAVTASTSGRALKVFGYDALAAEEKRRRMWEGIAVGLAAGANAYSASQQGHYTQYGTVHGRYNAYGSSGYSHGSFNGSVVVSGYDPVAASVAISNANFQNAQMVGAVQAQQSNRSAALESTIFRSQTIAPGTSYGGALYVELPRKGKRGSNHQVDIAIGSLETFTVFVDAAPSSAQLAALPKPEPRPLVAESVHVDTPAAETQLVAVVQAPVSRESVMPTAPEIAGVVRNLSRERTRGAAGREYVFFDVDWTISEPVSTRSRVEGRVTLLDAAGRARVEMPWPLEREPTLGRSFSEQGVGLPIDDIGAAADWLRAAAPNEITIRYSTAEPDQ